MSGVQYCCHEWWGKCNMKVGHKVSGSQETGNENFTVTINPPFVFAVLTLHGHVWRYDYFSKYLDCLLFYKQGSLKSSSNYVTAFGADRSGKQVGVCSPWLTNGAWAPQAAWLRLFLFLPLQTLSTHAAIGTATKPSRFTGSISYFFN